MTLAPALERANGSRIINIASRGHRAAGVQFEDINFKHSEYTDMRAYAQTKTAFILLLIKEDELLKDKNIRAFAVHPGPFRLRNFSPQGPLDTAVTFKMWLGIPGRLGACNARYGNSQLPAAPRQCGRYL
ncbi:hypothetical protein [Pseudomonas sp. SJZ103]|uniref:hypothetical protein n=1 Tax=Pseudomonas sp. SJZ103 TaxID=2572893 RepID=UPI001C49904E|nr:hypothetical protein [Pseudomonas sp. SJZ103]